MKISTSEFKVLKITPNSTYNDVKPEFLFRSNKARLEVALTTGDLTYFEQTLADYQRRFVDKMRERGVARLIDDLRRTNLD